MTVWRRPQQRRGPASDGPASPHSNIAAVKTFSEKLERHVSDSGDPEPLVHYAFRHTNSANGGIQATGSQRGFLFDRKPPPTIPLSTNLLIGNAMGRSWKHCEHMVELPDSGSTWNGTTHLDLYRCRHVYTTHTHA